jgi:hypothetical protein
MDENKAELKARLQRALRRRIPQATWNKYDRDGWIEDFYENKLDHREEEENFRALKDVLAKELEYLDQIEQEKTQAVVDEREMQSTSDALSDQNIEAESKHFEVELGDYERERQRAFAEVVVRETSEHEQVLSFRQDYLGGSVLTPDQAYSFLDSPAARYFAANLFLDLQIPAAEHRARIVGQYEQVQHVPNEVDHRVTVRVDPPGITQRVRYARRECRVTDGDQIDIQHRVFKDSEHTVIETPDEVLLHYRDRHGLQSISHIWPGSVLDELRYASSKLAKRYGWKEEDMVWFFLTGEAPRLSTPTLNVRFTTGNLPTITLTAPPWISAETIKKNYKKVQSQVLVKGNHALSLRSIAVLRFVERSIRERGKRQPWSELLARWNREHPEWKYEDYRNLSSTYYRTLKAVAYAPVRLPKWKLSPAQEKRIRKAVDRSRETVELDRKRATISR